MRTHRLIHLIALAVFCLIAPGRAAAGESTALAVLASPDATLHDKAMACDELGRVGTAKAVPPLAELLADEKLHDYARDGLERIQDPAAGKALRNSLRTLRGNQRIGVIITLGDRREKAAVPALVRIVNAKRANPLAIDAALTSLGQIGTDRAVQAVLAVLAEGEAASKVSAAKAALAVAQRMEGSAMKLRDAVVAAEVPATFKQAADK